MLHRRLFLGSSAALITTPFLPTVAYGQWEYVLLAAKTIVEIYGAASSYNFQQVSLTSLGAIESQLKIVNTKLDDVIVMLQALPAVMKELLTDSQRNLLSAQIQGAESTIISILSRRARWECVDRRRSKLIAPAHGCSE